LKRLGFSAKEIKRMKCYQALFWLECIALNAELSKTANQGGEDKEVHDLSELVGILPKTEAKKDGVKHQG